MCGKVHIWLWRRSCGKSKENRDTKKVSNCLPRKKKGKTFGSQHNKSFWPLRRNSHEWVERDTSTLFLPFVETRRVATHRYRTMVKKRFFLLSETRWSEWKREIWRFFHGSSNAFLQIGRKNFFLPKIKVRSWLMRHFKRWIDEFRATRVTVESNSFHIIVRWDLESSRWTFSRLQIALVRHTRGLFLFRCTSLQVVRDAWKIYSLTLDGFKWSSVSPLNGKCGKWILHRR